jgi:hypothetical protein
MRPSAAPSSRRRSAGPRSLKLADNIIQALRCFSAKSLFIAQLNLPVRAKHGFTPQ